MQTLSDYLASNPDAELDPENPIEQKLYLNDPENNSVEYFRSNNPADHKIIIDGTTYLVDIPAGSWLRQIRTGGGDDTIEKTNGGSYGGGGNDTFVATATSGTGENHIYGGGGDDKITMNFSDQGFTDQLSSGHHVIDSSGNDTYSFANIFNVGSGKNVVGRINDFDYFEDTLIIDGVTVDLLNLPVDGGFSSAGGGFTVRVVEYNGDHNDDNTSQQWLLIEVKDGGQIFYALDAPRPYVPSGPDDNSKRTDENHFIKTVPDFDSLTDVIFDSDDNIDIRGTVDDDSRTGGATDEVIATGAGNDTVNAGGGDDTVYGGSGNDTLYGGQEDDTLYGGAGHDSLTGGSGADALFGGDGVDRAKYSEATEGVIVDLEDTSLNTEDAAGDTFDSIEDLQGSSHADALFGDSGINRLWGASGNDQLHGRGGNDKLYGGAGSDRLEGGEGADQLFGGSGTDRAQYSTASSSVTVDLQFDHNNTGDAAGDTFDSIEDLQGSIFGDSLRGDTQDNRIWGAGGNDVIYGRDGDDTLFGGSGNDILNGGSGNDSLYGAAGADVFHFNGSGGEDIIHDFEVGIDSIRISDFSGDMLSAATQVGDDVIIDFGGGDILTIENVILADVVEDFVFV